jgi:hypothetical protein
MPYIYIGDENHLGRIEDYEIRTAIGCNKTVQPPIECNFVRLNLDSDFKTFVQQCELAYNILSRRENCLLYPTDTAIPVVGYYLLKRYKISPKRALDHIFTLCKTIEYGPPQKSSHQAHFYNLQHLQQRDDILTWNLTPTLESIETITKDIFRFPAATGQNCHILRTALLNPDIKRLDLTDIVSDAIRQDDSPAPIIVDLAYVIWKIHISLQPKFDSEFMIVAHDLAFYQGLPIVIDKTPGRYVPRDLIFIGGTFRERGPIFVFVTYDWRPMIRLRINGYNLNCIIIQALCYNNSKLLLLTNKSLTAWQLYVDGQLSSTVEFTVSEDCITFSTDFKLSQTGVFYHVYCLSPWSLVDSQA